jgi:hypothetical protein
VRAKVMLIASFGLCLSNASVAPMAEGAFPGTIKATQAARRCGLKYLRVQVHEDITMLFDEGGRDRGGGDPNRHCLVKWTDKNAARL